MNTKTYTLGQIKNCIYKELDEFSRNGEQIYISDSEKSDLELRMLYAINSSLARVCISMPLPSQDYSAFLKEPPVVYFNQNISASEFSFEPMQTLTDISVHFYYTSVCEISLLSKDGTVLYQDKANSPEFKLSEYKKVFNLSEPIALITLKGQGNDLNVSDLVIRNVQSSKYDPQLICPYGQICIPLPQNTSFVKAVSVEGRILCENDYYVKDNTLFCNSKYKGKAVITYIPCAPEFTPDSFDDQQVHIPENVFLATIYLAAAQLCSVENGQCYTRLMANYQNLLANGYNCDAQSKVKNNFYKTTRKLFGRR